jgi:DNA-binding beta-propeller fold protein YncE
MSDPDRQRVAVLDLEQGSITYFGVPGVDPGQFRQPSGIAVGPNNQVYVVDWANGNVQVFTVHK